MKRQATGCKPDGDGLFKRARLLLSAAVHHDIVRISLKLYRWVQPLHPGVKRIVQIEVRQHGTEG